LFVIPEGNLLLHLHFSFVIPEGNLLLHLHFSFVIPEGNLLLLLPLSVLAVILSASFEREGPRRSSPRQYRPNLSPNNATVISSLFVILNGVKNPRISSLLVLACHSAA
jgi:hypothetical protein